MSNRERIISLLDNIPDYKMGYVLAYVQGITADEEADDAFCERMRHQAHHRLVSGCLKITETTPTRKRIRDIRWKNARQSGGLTDVPDHHQEGRQKVY